MPRARAWWQGATASRILERLGWVCCPRSRCARRRWAAPEPRGPTRPACTRCTTTTTTTTTHTATAPRPMATRPRATGQAPSRPRGSMSPSCLGVRQPRCEALSLTWHAHGAAGTLGACCACLPACCAVCRVLLRPVMTNHKTRANTRTQVHGLATNPELPSLAGRADVSSALCGMLEVRGGGGGAGASSRRTAPRTVLLVISMRSAPLPLPIPRPSGASRRRGARRSCRGAHRSRRRLGAAGRAARAAAGAAALRRAGRGPPGARTAARDLLPCLQGGPLC
jgi:hypothetical protein